MVLTAVRRGKSLGTESLWAPSYPGKLLSSSGSFSNESFGIRPSYAVYVHLIVHMYGIKDRGEEEESNAPTAVTRSGKLGLSGFSNSSTRLVWSARLWTVTRISDALIRKIDLHKLVDWQCALARVSSCVHNANAASNILDSTAVAVNSFHEFLFSPCSSKEFLSSLFFAAITSLNCFLLETLVLVNPVCFSGLLTIPIRSLIFLLLALIS